MVLVHEALEFGAVILLICSPVPLKGEMITVPSNKV
jgi:hypothetical protein